MYSLALVHFLSSLSAIIVGLGLFSAALVVVLRRSGVTLRDLARQAPFDGSVGGERTLLPHAAAEPYAPPGGDPCTDLDLGPSYAEELRLRQEEARLQEEAMLRQLFEQNVRLREEIAGLAGAATCAPS
jgi:hypothetical protein